MTTHETTRAERVRASLLQALRPEILNVEDESAQHAGHAGAQPGGETHYRVSIVSESFTGLSRVARSRMVHTILQQELLTGLHALSLELRSPHEL